MSMPPPTGRKLLIAGALLGALLVGCGGQRGEDDRAAQPAGSPPATSAGEAPPTAGSNDPASPHPSASSSAAGSPPYREPGSGDGAPHYGENNAYRQPKAMSPGSEKAAEAEAERIRPVLKRLWDGGDIGPSPVRRELLKLGYRADALTVRSLRPSYVGTEYVTMDGALIGLWVRDDACVTGWIQKSNFEVKTNGPFTEHGCIEPPSGH
ncbi:hypothetical protein [Streptomyces sp. TP-A0874]|uniref:hypothetical protein n=1 Tax=Streptomyces sp. TP-A0874 TaxID=549819 RepID=UPI0008530DEC|nr:hypothetical protein [Streptomyces sp. TP-A0874]